ncbi:prostasin-like [Teleopsis dalmanni]|uniref:prostasin-like n=1 Tax=Teleopsis dalmanni TaxID=139649 RepID=UPI0018CDD27C|nr:prostasin-like [Teleopsis dalmanni]
MFKLLVCLTAITGALCATIPGGRIVGGQDTTINEFPWQISLQRSGSHICGGSIYNNNIILTSAHCVDNVQINVLRVRVGSSYWNSGGRVISVSSVYIHENYNANTLANDIALVKLSSSLSYSATIQSIALASETPDDGTHAMVTGWGTKSYGSADIPSRLQYTDVEVISQATCSSSAYSYGTQIKDTMICTVALGGNACHGDFGGPLVAEDKLIGIVSWSIGCAQINYPSVYINIADFKKWIENAVVSIYSLSILITSEGHLISVFKNIFEFFFFLITNKMFRIITALVLIIGISTNSIAGNRLPQQRIINGQYISISRHPSTVSLRMNGTPICGGSIVTSSIVLTAAHCFIDPTASYTILYGCTSLDNCGNVRDVLTYYIHPNFDHNTYDYDLALVITSKIIDFHAYSQPIAIGRVLPSDNTNVTIFGYGATQEGGSSKRILQEATIPIVNSATCQVGNFPYFISSNMFCTVGKDKDACQGDSGGPVIYNRTLVGIISWGIGCGRSDRYGVNTNIPKMYNYINDLITQLS